MLFLLNTPNSNVTCNQLCLKAPRIAIILRRSSLLMIIFKDLKASEILRKSGLCPVLQNNDSCRYVVRVWPNYACCFVR